VRCKLISAHPLEIETGRYSKPCSVEGKLHFLHDCSLYDNIREAYYPSQMYNSNSDVSKENNCKILCNPTNVVQYMLEGYVNFYMLALN
jgi:hypothetical protein